MTTISRTLHSLCHTDTLTVSLLIEVLITTVLYPPTTTTTKVKQKVDAVNLDIEMYLIRFTF